MTVGGSHFLPKMVMLGLKNNLRLIEVPVMEKSDMSDML